MIRDHLHQDVLSIKREVLRLTPPEYFSSKDLARSFFGALFLASTFIFSGGLVQQAKLMSTVHIIVLVLVTLAVLTVEIYFIGYHRVKNKKTRPFYEFWGKRIVTFWSVALVVSFGLSLLYAFDQYFPTTLELVKFSMVVSFPASVGAALADLLRSY